MHDSKKKSAKSSRNSKQSEEVTWKKQNKLLEKSKKSNEVTKIPLEFHSIARENREVEYTTV